MYKDPILAKSRDAFLLLQGKNVTFLVSRLAHSGYLSPPYLLMWESMLIGLRGSDPLPAVD